jgi:phosphatidylglycerophosphatase A
MVLDTICVLSTVSLFWGIHGEKTVLGAMQRAGIFTLCLITTVSAVVGITFLVKYIQHNKREKHKRYIWDEIDGYIDNPEYVEPRPNLVKEFIKAKYHKYCPKIDWTK